MAGRKGGKGVEVGVGYVSIVPSTKGFAAQLKADLNPRKLGNDIGKDLDQGIEQGIGKDPVGKRLAPSKESTRGARSQLDSMLGGLKNVAVGAAAAGGVIVAAGVEAFKAYSDQNEAITKAQQVFGDAFGRVDAVARTAAKTMGMSRATALDSAATFGNLFRAMGIGVDQAADMSLSIEQLAADLGSFNNVPVEDALDALKSGLVGETEPMRRFGSNISQARLEAEALSLGLVHNNVVSSEVASATTRLEKAQQAAALATKQHGKDSLQARDAMNQVQLAEAAVDKAMAGHRVELDAAQKAQAAYSLIMKDTTIAQGNFALTANDAANKTKTLGAQWDDFKARIGEKLAPLGTAVLGGLETALTWLNDWWVLHGDDVVGGLNSIKDWFTNTFGPDPAANFAAGMQTIQDGLDGIFGEDKIANYQAGVDVVSKFFDDVFGEDKIANFQHGADLVATAMDGIFGEDKVANFQRGADIITKFMDDVFGEDKVGNLQKGAEALGKLWSDFMANPIPTVPQPGDRPEGHADGGVIGGPLGAPRLVVAHGGETVLPTHRPNLAGLRGVTAGQLAPAATGGPLVGTMTVNGQVNPADTAWAMRRELRRVAYYAGSAYGSSG